jgi:hypothetical protein
MMREGLKKATYIAGIASLVLLALTGCSGAGSSSLAALDLKSPDVEPNGVTKPGIHCGWGPMWITLEWEKPPDGTKELAIFFGRFKYVKTGDGRKPVVNYADLFSGVKPSLRRLPANEVPEGADWSNIGTSCPAERTGQRLVAQVLALDQADAPRQLKRPLATQLAEEALAEPHPREPSQSPGPLTGEAVAIGRLIAFDGTPRR